MEKSTFNYLEKLFEDIAIRFQETDKKFKETDRQFKETDKKFEEVALRFQETDKKFKETDRQFKETDKKFEEVALRFQETDKKFKETDRQFKETDKKFQETDKIFRVTDEDWEATKAYIDRISKEIGHLGNRFGEFNEALVLPSLNKLFENEFNCKRFSQRHRLLMNGNTMEIDLLAISAEAVYIIEINSKYRKDDLKQLLKHIKKYKEITPEHSNKKIYGVIVATDYNKDNIKELEKKGIYFISISDDLVKLHQPPNFVPHPW